MVRADAHLFSVCICFCPPLQVLMNKLQIFGSESIIFQQLPELVNRYLLPPDPIILHYHLNPATAPPEKPSAWDVEVKLDDTHLKSRMNGIVVQMASDTARDLAKLDEDVRHLLLFFTLQRNDKSNLSNLCRYRCTCNR